MLCKKGKGCNCSLVFNVVSKGMRAAVNCSLVVNVVSKGMKVATVLWSLCNEEEGGMCSLVF